MEGGTYSVTSQLCDFDHVLGLVWLAEGAPIDLKEERHGFVISKVLCPWKKNATCLASFLNVNLDDSNVEMG